MILELHKSLKVSTPDGPLMKIIQLYDSVCKYTIKLQFNESTLKFRIAVNICEYNSRNAQIAKSQHAGLSAIEFSPSGTRGHQKSEETRQCYHSSQYVMIRVVKSAFNR
jgi:hypothetical protein